MHGEDFCLRCESDKTYVGFTLGWLLVLLGSPCKFFMAIVVKFICAVFAIRLSFVGQKCDH